MSSTPLPAITSHYRPRLRSSTSSPTPRSGRACLVAGVETGIALTTPSVAAAARFGAATDAVATSAARPTSTRCGWFVAPGSQPHSRVGVHPVAEAVRTIGEPEEPWAVPARNPTPVFSRWVRDAVYLQGRSTLDGETGGRASRVPRRSRRAAVSAHTVINETTAGAVRLATRLGEHGAKRRQPTGHHGQARRASHPVGMRRIRLCGIRAWCVWPSCGVAKYSLLSCMPIHPSTA